MRERKYFISYNFVKNGEGGSGCTEAEIDFEIQSVMDIFQIANQIKEKYSYDQVVIIFWREF